MRGLSWVFIARGWPVVAALCDVGRHAANQDGTGRAACKHVVLDDPSEIAAGPSRYHRNACPNINKPTIE